MLVGMKYKEFVAMVPYCIDVVIRSSELILAELL
jgi:hypothetical protein